MGRPRKVVKETENLEKVEEIQVSAPQESEPEKQISKCGPPHLPKCQCTDQIGPGQAAFEDGQTGTIIIGEATKGEIMLRYMEGGREYTRRINKKR